MLKASGVVFKVEVPVLDPAGMMLSKLLKCDSAGPVTDVVVEEKLVKLLGFDTIEIVGVLLFERDSDIDPVGVLLGVMADPKADPVSTTLERSLKLDPILETLGPMLGRELKVESGSDTLITPLWPDSIEAVDEGVCPSELSQELKLESERPVLEPTDGLVIDTKLVEGVDITLDGLGIVLNEPSVVVTSGGRFPEELPEAVDCAAKLKLCPGR